MNAPDIPPGTAARAATPLRPSGKVAIDDATFDARAEGEWFDAGQPVAVLRADGFGLVVGRPGTVSLAAIRGPEPSPASAPSAGTEGGSGSSMRGESYLAGLLAFAALGTSIGGVLLLILAFVTPPRRLLRLLPLYLGGGAVLGPALFHLGLLGAWWLHRRSRGISRR